MKKTILVVDDSENSLFVTGFSLQSKGYNIIKSKSAQDALNQMNGQTIDLVISDYNMPQMNGLQMVEKMKQIPQYSKTPIFILSNEIRTDVKELAIKLGVTIWIKKPFNLKHLSKLVERALL